jgi:hypothetical protein
MSLETILITSACLIGGTGIAIGCCALRDWMAAQDERRRINQRRSLEHRKLSFKRPYDRGNVAADFVMLSASCGLLLAAFHYIATKQLP